MALYKVLSPLIAVIITINNTYDKSLYQHTSPRLCIFDNQHKYEYCKNDVLLDSVPMIYVLSFPNKTIPDKISTLQNPTIELYLDGKKYIARGTHYLSSSVPDNADLFFGINDKGHIVFAQNQKLFLRIK